MIEADAIEWMMFAAHVANIILWIMSPVLIAYLIAAYGSSRRRQEPNRGETETVIVTCEPTPEIDLIKINGVEVPMRIWTGITEKGTSVELLVVSIIPKTGTLGEFVGEVPKYMRPTRELFSIGGT